MVLQNKIKFFIKNITSYFINILGIEIISIKYI